MTAALQPTATNRPLSREATGLCADPLFRVFLKEECGMFGIAGTLDAIHAVRLLCRVTCLSQFDQLAAEAAGNWQNLLRRYRLWLEPPSTKRTLSRIAKHGTKPNGRKRATASRGCVHANVDREKGSRDG